MTIKIKHKRGTASSITTANPTLAAGELAFETDTRRFKVGDGTTAWSSLSYVTPYVTATDRILGRSSAGAGAAEEISCGSFGRSLIGSADAAAARTTLSVQPTASPAFTGTVSAAAANFTGAVSVTSPLTLTGTVAGNVRALKLQTSGSDRWQITPGFDAESGSNAGSTLWITRWSDAGAFLGTPIAISRATGSVTLENPLFVQAGSASACGVAFSGDPDTGFAQLSAAGANTLSICTNSAEAVRVNASQNVGIGVSPTHRLDCNGEFRLRGTGASTEAGKLHLYWVSSTNRATWTTDASGNALIETGSSSPAERFRVGVNGRSQFFAANEKYGIQLNKSTTANGPFIGSDGADIFTVSASGGGELLRIDASGNVGIGVSPLQRLHVIRSGTGIVGRFTDNSTQTLDVGVTASAGVYLDNPNSGYVDFQIGGVSGMRLTGGSELLIGTTTDNGAYKLQVNSQIYATNATIATSDARFKKNVEALTDATAVIEDLRPVAFDFIPHAERNFATERQVGLIAQEAQSALAGTDYADSVVAQCGDHLGLAYEKLVPVLIKALQESNARIAALEERVNHA